MWVRHIPIYPEELVLKFFLSLTPKSSKKLNI